MHLSANVNNAHPFCFLLSIHHKENEIGNYHAVFCKTHAERKTLKSKLYQDFCHDSFQGEIVAIS